MALTNHLGNVGDSGALPVDWEVDQGSQRVFSLRQRP